MRHELLAVLQGLNLDDEGGLSLGELSRVCAVHAEWVISLVEEGALEPSGRAPANWRFSAACLRRTRTAIRLQKDLDINLAGVALALDLLDEIAALRRRMQLLETRTRG